MILFSAGSRLVIGPSCVGEWKIVMYCRESNDPKYHQFHTFSYSPGTFVFRKFLQIL